MCQNDEAEVAKALNKLFTMVGIVLVTIVLGAVGCDRVSDFHEEEMARMGYEQSVESVQGKDGIQTHKLWHKRTTN